MRFRNFRQVTRCTATRKTAGYRRTSSTAAGVQRASGKPTLAIVGDLSALSDLNALALLHRCAPLVLIVVNNNGGQIFSLLPTPQSEHRRCTRCHKTFQFEHAAAIFKLKISSSQNWQDLKRHLPERLTPTTTVIEMVVNDTDGAQTLQQLLAQVSHL
ncbi:thiamine pyrophosphate-dependent enzyme [Escherichia coli]